ncbi:MAG: hypothetical protein B7Y12_02055 [Rhizobiales bacterium 24-66-13]|jgi:hypothetical protein|nr:MAG: hypothetical protein B7Z41_04130 [Rhizobiales bacterium 12-66-7]OYY88805.1 MAG: hypothetical protein B7Y61_01085 [Rhizobiales bacterium 35-66-30]OYZ82799.1 MAG: hypothetical protein B7Y12_02055 [Rhizobiales bacterium 24-66-13]OZB11832.1 MAG: hypothetical protein B7X67_02035 [Rhizobiales bacterium 39-66-18]
MEISDQERGILARIGSSYSIATWWIAQDCGFGGNSAKARNALRKLERRGFTEGVAASRSGRVFWWRLTQAGRAALVGGGDAAP